MRCHKVNTQMLSNCQECTRKNIDILAIIIKVKFKTKIIKFREEKKRRNQLDEFPNS